MKMAVKHGGKDMRKLRLASIFNMVAKLIVIMSSLFIIWIILHVFLLGQYSINTPSMEPTIRPGDKVIVNKSIIGARIYTSFNFNKSGSELKAVRMRGLRELKHNDIVVFNYPFHDGGISFVLNDVYVKRCIGLPGDSIGIVNGFYLNNNEIEVGLISSQLELSKMDDHEIDSFILRKKHYDAHYTWTIKDMPPLYVPRKGDIIHITPKEGYLYKHILEWETGKKLVIDWERNHVYVGHEILRTHKFLHNYVFVAGDNVLNSQDSRYWGVVPEDYIVGVVECILH